jgi:hypothetical protein
MITVFVGDVDESIAVAAKSYDNKAELVTQKNFKRVSRGTYYISIGDFDHDILLYDFISVLKKADTIIYSPPVRWSDVDDSGRSYMKDRTEYELLNFKCFEFKDVRNVEGIQLPNLKTMLELETNRQSDKPQLWVAGCSITHGQGVNDDERYGQLISNKLNLPVSFLTRPGSSITWAADQILRSDIRSGDILVWGVTAVERIPYFKDNQLWHLNGVFYKDHSYFNVIVPFNRLFEKDVIYQAITDIHKVINFCNKVNVKLVLAGILTDLNHYTLDFDNYVPLCYHSDKAFIEQFKDLGTDNSHPGPVTHKWYAEQILGQLK